MSKVQSYKIVERPIHARAPKLNVLKLLFSLTLLYDEYVTNITKNISTIQLIVMSFSV